VPAEGREAPGEPGAADQPGDAGQDSQQEQAEKALERALGGGPEKPAAKKK